MDDIGREERRDDEELDEFFSTTWKANVKETFDRDRALSFAETRAALRDMLADVAQERRHREEEHDMRMRHKEELFSQRQHHRDMAYAQDLRDQARDSQSGKPGPDPSP